MIIDTYRYHRPQEHRELFLEFTRRHDCGGESNHNGFQKRFQNLKVFLKSFEHTTIRQDSVHKITERNRRSKDSRRGGREPNLT